MRKILLAAAGAAAMTLGATSASAVPLVVGGSVVVPVPSSGTFGNSFSTAVAGTQFTDMYNFVLSANSMFDSSLISYSLGTLNNIDFNPANPNCSGCGVFLDGTAFNLNSSGGLDVFTLSPALLADGGLTHTLTVTGYFTSGPTASYAGTFNANLPAVPEPGTWALMLLGFGATGFMLRRRNRRSVLAQVA